MRKGVLTVNKLPLQLIGSPMALIIAVSVSYLNTVWSIERSLKRSCARSSSYWKCGTVRQNKGGLMPTLECAGQWSFEDEEEQGQEDRDKSKDEEDESKEQEDESKDQGTRSKKHSSLF